MAKKHLFSWLLKKAVSMALWTKAGLCGKSSLSEQSLPRTPSRPKTSVISVAKNLFNQRNPRLMNYLPFLVSLWLKNPFNQRNPRLMNYLPFLVSLWLKNPFNQRNQRLINYLYAFGISTTVVSALQIHLFLQNKPNFRKSQMNVSDFITRDYEKKTLGERGKKQSQTNPNKPKFKKAKMNVTFYITKAYENKPPFRAPKKQSQISKRQKPMQTSLPQRIMKKTAFSGPGKTNPIQSQTKPISEAKLHRQG